MGVTLIERAESEFSREQTDQGSKDFSRRALEEVQSCRTLPGSLGGSIHRDTSGQEQVRCQVTDSSGAIRDVLPPLQLSSGDGSGKPPREGHGRF